MIKSLPPKKTGKNKDVDLNDIEALKQLPPSPEEDFWVEPADDSFSAVKIVGYKYKSKDDIIVIPATIQGLPVKWIESFDGPDDGNGHRYNDVKAVVIPEGVKAIGYCAFIWCTKLQTVIIPEGVTYIGGNSFIQSENLSTVVLPSTLKVIGKEAFCCTMLNWQSIELPSGLLYIGDQAFTGKIWKSVNLPEGLLWIGENAFGSLWCLDSVSLPKSLKFLGLRAFQNCDSLAEIQIPEDHNIGTHGACTFEWFFSGQKIKESIALQKLLKENKPREMSAAEQERIKNDIFKQAGLKQDKNGYYIPE